MIENSPITHKNIYNSFTKLQKVSSDGKFRVKSLRVKTLSNEIQDHISQRLGLPSIFPNQTQKKIHSPFPQIAGSPMRGQSSKDLKAKSKSAKIIQKNYEEELNKLGVSSQFLQKLYECKSEEIENKMNDQRYQLFVKNLALRLCKNKNLVISQLGLGTKSTLYFLNWYVQWNGHVTELDFTSSSDILKEGKMDILTKLLERDENLMSITLCNSSIAGEDIMVLFDLITKKKQLFSLDLSNNNSQALNRFGEQIAFLETFVKDNQSVAILKLNNMQLKKEGLEHIWRGVSPRKINPLRVLSISNNYIAGSKIVGDYFHGLIKSGLLRLNMSENPLGEEFYKNLPLLKSTTIRELDLSSTNMNSQQFYDFLGKIEESKSLSTLILDKNDFSHHWFGKIGQKLQTNNSIEFLSINDCQIKSFMSLFHGLTQNKYMKRLHASNNAVDSDVEMLRKIGDCFVYNKELEELKFKFCNLNEQILIKMFEAISQNKKLRVLDVSQNLMEDEGAEAILKMLDKNYKIEHLGIEKLQFSQHLRAKIQSKLQENKSIREREELIALESITKDMKLTDQFTWEDVQRYEDQQRMLEQKYVITEKKVAKLEDMVASKRQKVAFYTKEVKDAQKEMEQAMKEKIRAENQRVRYAERDTRQLQKRETAIKLEKQKEKKLIESLETNLRAVNERIKIKQNQLEEIYRNHKYLHRKRKSKQRAENSPNRRPSLSHHSKPANKHEH